MVKTPHFHCRGSRFDPCSGKLRSCMLHKSESESLSVVSDSLQPHGLKSPRNSPGQNTGVGSHSLLQEVFPTQGSNPGLPHCRQIFTSWATRETHATQCGQKKKKTKYRNNSYSLTAKSNLIKKWEDVNRHVSKKTRRWPTGTWKDVQHHYLSGKWKWKPQWDITSHLCEWLLSKRQEITSASQGVEKRNFSHTAGWSISWWNQCGKQYGVPSKN